MPVLNMAVVDYHRNPRKAGRTALIAVSCAFLCGGGARYDIGLRRHNKHRRANRFLFYRIIGVPDPEPLELSYESNQPVSL